MTANRRVLEAAVMLGVDPSVVEFALDRSVPNRLGAVAVLLGQPADVLRRRAAKLNVDTHTALDWLVLAA